MCVTLLYTISQFSYASETIHFGANISVDKTLTEKCFESEGKASVSACTELVDEVRAIKTETNPLEMWAMQQLVLSSFLEARGAAYYQLKNYSLAKNDYAEAVTSNPKNEKLYYWLGRIADNQKNPKLAETYNNKAIDINPDYGLAINSRGNRLLKKKKFKEATKDFEKAISSEPKNPVYYANLGIAFSQLTENSKAFSSFQKAYSIDPNNTHVLVTYSWFLATNRTKEFRDGHRAIQLIEKAIEQDDSILFRDIYAAALAEAGRFDEAVVQQNFIIDHLEQTKLANTKNYTQALRLYEQKKKLRCPAEICK